MSFLRVLWGSISIIHKKSSNIILIISLLSYFLIGISNSNKQYLSSLQTSRLQLKDGNDTITKNYSSTNPCRTVISFVNGIYHTQSECESIANKLEAIFAEEVRVFYNPSTGNWLSDAYRAGYELLYKPDDLLIAKSLALHLRKALKDVGTDGELLILSLLHI